MHVQNKQSYPNHCVGELGQGSSDQAFRSQGGDWEENNKYSPSYGEAQLCSREGAIGMLLVDTGGWELGCCFRIGHIQLCSNPRQMTTTTQQLGTCDCIDIYSWISRHQSGMLSL